MRTFMNSANTVKIHKGGLIIGSIHKQTGQVSFGLGRVHTTVSEANTEAARLATQYPDKKFLILKLVGIAST